MNRESLKLARIDRAILDFVAMYYPDGNARSIAIADHLRKKGFWFVDARYWRALRRLEDFRFLKRTEHPGTPERGGRPSFSFSLTRTRQ